MGSDGAKGFNLVHVLLALALAMAAAVIIWGPLATNDGPVHISFARFYADGLGEMQSRIYQFNWVLVPNWMVTLVAAFFIKLFGPEVAESIVQAMAMVLPVVLGAWCFEGIRKGSGWLAFPLFAFAFDRLFFLGLYNFKLSVAGFFLVLGVFVRGRERPSALFGLKLLLALLVTYFCHAAGFVAAVVAMSGITAYDLFVRWRAGEPLSRLVVGAASIILPIAGGTVVFLAATLLDKGDDIIVFGQDVFTRITRILSITALWMHASVAKMAGPLITLALLIAAAVVLWRAYREREAWWAGPKGALAAGVVLVFILALVFPDRAGGGWGHVQRVAAFPIFCGLAWLAAWDHPRAVRAGVVVVSVLGAALLGALTITAQAQIRREMTDFDAADRMIGEHCIVVPVILNPYFGGEHPIRYAPFFHAATRFEMRGDRVALFNYLARLDIYPIALHHQNDPQRLVYHWKPNDPAIMINVVDIPGFEKATGLTADYVVVRGLAAGEPVDAGANVTAWGGLKPYLTQHYDARPIGDSLVLFERRARGPKCQRAVG